MKSFNATFTSEDKTNFKTSLNAKDMFNASLSMGSSSAGGTLDYNKLKNKPSINGVSLEGDKTSEELNLVFRATTDYWNSQKKLVAQPNAIYVYTDYKSEEDGEGGITYYPALKVGDGTSYLIDMPFITSENPEFNRHINDSIVHITSEEREFWNNKWSGFINPIDFSNLVFTTN